MGIHPRLLFVQAHVAQMPHRQAARISGIDASVNRYRFCNLVRYPLHRVQGVFNILKDHGHLRSPQLSEFLCRDP